MKSNQESERQALALAMAAGAAMGRITPARLMSPTEVAAVNRSRPDLQSKLSGWYLCTEVPEAMWQRVLDVQGTGVGNHVSVAEAPSGRRYLIVIFHAPGWQHRVCIPLLGNLTAGWLGSIISTRRMQLSIANASTNRTFVWDSGVPAGAIAELRCSDTRIPDDVNNFMDEAFRFVTWNAVDAKNRPVEQMPRPKEVSVALLLPAEVEGLLERRTEEWTTSRKLN